MPHRIRCLIVPVLIAWPLLVASSCPDPDVNRAPRASLRVPQAADVNETVALDGSESSDPDGDRLSFEWAQIGGPDATIENADQPEASFTPTAVGEYEFELTVSDGNGGSDTATARIIVKATNGDDNDNDNGDGTIDILEGDVTDGNPFDDAPSVEIEADGDNTEGNGIDPFAGLMPPCIGGDAACRVSIDDWLGGAGLVTESVDRAGHVYRTYLILCPTAGVFVFVTLIDGVSSPVSSQFFLFNTQPGEQLLLEAGSSINGGLWYVESPDNYNVVIKAEFGTVNPPNETLLQNGVGFYVHVDSVGNIYVNGVRATVIAAGDTCFAS